MQKFRIFIFWSLSLAQLSSAWYARLGDLGCFRAFMDNIFWFILLNRFQGHCGCHYDVFKWDRIAYYFSGFQKFKVMLVLFSATSLIFATDMGQKPFLEILHRLFCIRLTVFSHSKD